MGDSRSFVGSWRRPSSTACLTRSSPVPFSSRSSRFCPSSRFVHSPRATSFGPLPQVEFSTACRNFGFNGEIRMIFEELDEDGGGIVTFDEFAPEAVPALQRPRSGPKLNYCRSQRGPLLHWNFWPLDRASVRLQADYKQLRWAHDCILERGVPAPATPGSGARHPRVQGAARGQVRQPRAGLGGLRPPAQGRPLCPGEQSWGEYATGGSAESGRLQCGCFRRYRVYV